MQRLKLGLAQIRATASMDKSTAWPLKSIMNPENARKRVLWLISISRAAHYSFFAHSKFDDRSIK